MDFIDFLQKNQILTAGAILGFLAIVFRAISSFFLSLLRAAWSQYAHQLEITHYSKSYEWFNDWIANQTPLWGPKHFMPPEGGDEASGIYGYDIDANNKKKERDARVLGIAPGTYIYKYSGKLLMVTYIYQEPKGNQANPFRKFTLRLLGGSKKMLENFLGEIHRHHKQETEDMVGVYSAISGSWQREKSLNKRPLSTLITEQNTAESIRADLEWFYGARSWYAERYIPYRRGYLLYGMPGTGKSSLAHCLASELGLELYVVQLAQMGLDDTSLRRLFKLVPPKSLLLLEDIDCLFSSRQTKPSNDVDLVENEDGSFSTQIKQSSPITLSGLLNALDGVTGQEGSVVIMTTNHPERLDPALIRPGRVDRKVEMKPAGSQEIERMYLRFFPDQVIPAKEFASRFDKPISQAELQEILLGME